MRTRYYWDAEQNKFVPEADYRRPERNTPHVIQDSCNPFLSHADGKVYDSKSAYRRELKARGLVELGNEEIKPRKREEDRTLERDLARAFSDYWK